MLSVIGKLFRRSEKITFSGSYQSFREAQAACGDSTGYQSSNVLNKTLEWTRAAIGKEKSELDGRALRVLSALQMAAESSQCSQFRVLDYGGALGAHYFELRPFLPKNLKIIWTVLELQETVQRGRQIFEVEYSELKFTENLPERESVDFLLASSVIQYLESPYSTIKTFCKVSPQYLLIDRLPLIEEDRLTIQRVPASIYKATYPAWFLSEKRFLKALNDIPYKLIQKWDVPEDIHVLDGVDVINRGFLLCKA